MDEGAADEADAGEADALLGELLGLWSRLRPEDRRWLVEAARELLRRREAGLADGPAKRLADARPPTPAGAVPAEVSPGSRPAGRTRRAGRRKKPEP